MGFNACDIENSEVIYDFSLSVYDYAYYDCGRKCLTEILKILISQNYLNFPAFFQEFCKGVVHK